jgi:amino acid transporter
VDDVFCERAAIVGMVVVASLVVALTIVVGWPVLRKNYMLKKSRFGEVWRMRLDAFTLILFLCFLSIQLFLLIMWAKYFSSPWTAPGEISMYFVWCPMMTFVAIVYPLWPAY